MKWSALKGILKSMILITAGSALCALAVNVFIKPNGFLSGGITGAALIIYYKWKIIPLGLLYMLINVPLFLLGVKFTGLKFILLSGWGMVSYSVLLMVINPVIDIPEKLLSALCAGVLGGTGVAIMLRSNGAAGGSEIISIALNKMYSISLGSANLVLNAVILAIALLLFPVENVLYTFVMIVANAKTMDAVFTSLAKRKAIMIISDKWQDILQELTVINNLGVTLLNGKGGYMGCEKTLLYSIVKSSHVSTLKRAVMRLDPSAFIAIMETTDIVSSTVGNQPPWKAQAYSLASNTSKMPETKGIAPLISPFFMTDNSLINQ